MSTVTDFDLLASDVDNFTVQEQGKMKGVMERDKGCLANPCHHGICAICLEKIVLQETALLKGCEHAYCVMCILRWASYNEHPKCPQCKNPFESLHVHRSLDGSLQDYMFEESVCLLLRATWFKPLVVVHQDEPYDEFADVYQYVYEEEYVDVAEYDDDLEDAYFNNSASLRIGNRRWGDNGFVRSGRREARPVHRSSIHDTAGAGAGVGSSSEPNNNKKEAGRRAKRALKREAADKAAAAKHQQLLVRMGRNPEPGHSFPNLSALYITYPYAPVALSSLCGLRTSWLAVFLYQGEKTVENEEDSSIPKHDPDFT
ncbi:hypothetical protein V2J09_006184 [Rumex salicifolius]